MDKPAEGKKSKITHPNDKTVVVYVLSMIECGARFLFVMTGSTSVDISYSIEKIRRLEKTPHVEIRPITILVGRNSAGKSTFLRSLPLLRQSVETRSSAPVLWYGDYVDFGDFDTAVAGGRESDEAAFSFKIKNLSGHYHGGPMFASNFRRSSAKLKVDELTVRYVVGSAGEKTVMRRIELSIPSEGIETVFTWDGKSSGGARLTVNGREMADLAKVYDLRSVQSRIFSVPFFVTRTKDSASGNKRYVYPDGIFADELLGLFKRVSNRKLSEETLMREVRRVLTADRFNRDVVSMAVDQTKTEAFKKIYMELLEKPDSDFSRNVLQVKKADRTFKVLDIVEDILTDFFESVGYLGPARAASERFYRKQELEVSEISPDGKNLPMFLASLSPSKLSGFSDWVESIFGYGVELSPSAGHISINLRAGARSVNVTDTGYGVSQILPVLGAIWWAGIKPLEGLAYRRNAVHSRTLCIEQPELHLHPAHQAKLADVLVGAVSGVLKEQRDHALSLVVETHSESLINRMGELIADGSISADDVQVVVFSAEDDINSPTEVTQATYDNDGVLSNWPFGFFNY